MGSADTKRKTIGSCSLHRPTRHIPHVARDPTPHRKGTIIEGIRTFRTSDGVRVAYHHLLPADGVPAAGPPVVMVHGLSSHARNTWLEPGTAQALLDAGREVVAVDMRGHGRSDTPHEPAFYGETRMSRDLVELWTELELREVDLVGHSMGSVVAMITAATDRRVRRLVLSGVGRYQLEYDGGPLKHFDTARLAEALEADAVSEIHDPGMQAYRRRIDDSDNDRRALAAHLRAFHTDPFEFDRITARTLVVAGADDGISPEPSLLAAAMPNAASLTVPGDHNIHTSRAFLDALLEFLEGRA